MMVFLFFACNSDHEFSHIKIQNAVHVDTGEVEVEELPPQIDTATEECPDRIWSATNVALDESCSVEFDPVPFQVVEEWSMSSFEEFPNYIRVLMTPLVGHLTDDNEDGVFGDGDIPDIVVVGYAAFTTYAMNSGVMRLISGDGSQVFWSKKEWEFGDMSYTMLAATTPAIGDVNGDGVPDIVSLVARGTGSVSNDSYHCRMAIINAVDGSLAFVNEEVSLRCRPPATALSDMEGDGTVEIIINNAIFNGEDGSLQAIGEYESGEEEGYWTGGFSFAADLDGDGTQELLAGASLYDHNGQLLCQTGDADGWPAVADLDGDGLGEIVISGFNDIAIFDPNCNLINWWALEDSGRGGPLTIADYDGDGEPEIGVASAEFYFVYEVDGSLLWKNLVIDSSSNCTGSSVYDFEGDGYAEVVYGDEEDLWIFSGLDGSVLLQHAGHNSGTANEYPITVDVDGDGQVEVVVPHDFGIYVLGGENESWVPAREVWNQHAYHISNINDDLSIPSPTLNNWPEWNNFRSGDIRINNGQGAALVDAIPILVDTCEDECELGTVQVVVQIGNSGLADIPAATPFSLYTEVAGERIILETMYTENMIYSGQSTPGIPFVFPVSLLPEGKLWVVVDDDGTGVGLLEECKEDNNEMLIDEGLCQ